MHRILGGMSHGEQVRRYEKGGLRTFYLEHVCSGIEAHAGIMDRFWDEESQKAGLEE